jgi:hypothetical protein
LCLSPRTIIAQAIRAILLASATAATLVGRRSINRPSRGTLLGSVLARVADDGHLADDQQPPQISIALLGDRADPIALALLETRPHSLGRSVTPI